MDLTINKNQPAFPPGDSYYSGLSKREMLAAMAMQGWLASYTPAETAKEEYVAAFAVRCADALLTALEK